VESGSYGQLRSFVRSFVRCRSFVVCWWSAGRSPSLWLRLAGWLTEEELPRKLQTNCRFLPMTSPLGPSVPPLLLWMSIVIVGWVGGWLVGWVVAIVVVVVVVAVGFGGGVGVGGWCSLPLVVVCGVIEERRTALRTSNCLFAASRIPDVALPETLLCCYRFFVVCE